MRLSLHTVAATLFLALPFTAFAHEHRSYQIGSKAFNITIGSLGEPVYVDDKSGVELIVEDLSAVPAQEPMADGMEEDEHGPVGVPAEGLEKTLKVEVSAGDQTKTFDLSPKWGEPGSYQAVFYPTAQTTYSYRLVGTINKVSVDLTFTCNPAGHPATEEETAPKKVSEGVTQTLKGGAFGCPRARTENVFPLPAATSADLTTRMEALEGPGGVQKDTLAFALAAAAIGLSFVALFKSKRP